MKLLSIALFAAIFSAVNAANILYLSNVVSPSHFIWCKSILSSLHARGHNITALSPDVEESKENFTYHHLDKVYGSIYNGTTELNFFEMGQKPVVELFMEFKDFFVNSGVAALESKGYQDLLNYPTDFKFDLVVYDFTGSSALLGLAHKFKNPPIVAVTPYLFSWKYTMLSGSPIFPAFLPTPDFSFSQQMSFKERTITTLVTLFEIAFETFYIAPTMNKLVHQIHPDAPHIDEIEKKSTKMIFVNSNPITDYRAPTFPHVKLVGGVQIQKPKELTAELKSIADRAKNGLVLFSLGTNVRSDQLGEERILRIIKALGRLSKYTFLWKFETQEKLPIELPKNIHIQPWIPQNSILAHQNTKLFISHCGLLSTQEALWHAVPVLGFPVFADQPQNALRLKNLGVGETLLVNNFTEDELYETIKKLLEDSKYQKKVKAISAALRDQPMTALEEATYWTEWVLRNPDIDMTSPTVNMSLIVRQSFDILVVFLIVIAYVFHIWIKLIKFVIKICSKKGKIDKIKKRN